MSGNYDERGQMTAERRAEVVKELGFASMPVPRYEDLPKTHDVSAVQEKWNFMKALTCVDVLASARFMNYLPNGIVVDQSMDPRSFKRGWTTALKLDTSQPIPVNNKITAATGIGHELNESNWYTWLAQHLWWYYQESGAKAISPCLVFRTRGEKKRRRWVARPMLGVTCMMDRSSPYSTVELSQGAQIGMLHPSTMEAENKVLPAAQVTMAGQGEPARDSLTTENGARIPQA